MEKTLFRIEQWYSLLLEVTGMLQISLFKGGQNPNNFDPCFI